MIDRVYCDGGVILTNPSPHGGTWAWVMLDGDEHHCGSGVVLASDIGQSVTNNFTEAYAAVQVLKGLPDDFAGTLFTDSRVTMCRLVNPRAKMKGLTKQLVSDLRKQVGRHPRLRVELVAGHPTRDELFRGIGSRWNVLCDRMCGAESLKYQRTNMKGVEVE